MPVVVSVYSENWNQSIFSLFAHFKKRQNDMTNRKWRWSVVTNLAQEGLPTLLEEKEWQVCSFLKDLRLNLNIRPFLVDIHALEQNL